MDKKEHKLNVLQSIISRMAANSANNKLWCVTILAALIIFYLTNNSSNTLSLKIIVLPIIPFLWLDAYYLGFERYYINQYNKVFSDEIKEDEVIYKQKWYEVLLNTLYSFTSFSIWGFYLILSIVVTYILKK